MKSRTRQFYRFWLFACTLGEFLGIALAAGIAAAHFYSFGEPATYLQKVGLLAVMVIAGLLEGSLIAVFQWRVLRLRFPKLHLRSWWTVTVTAAVTAWILGMLPSLVSASEEPTIYDPPLSLQIFTGLVLGVFLGALFGMFQWTALKRHADNSTKWIIGNALGWGLGLPVIFVAASLTPAGTPLLQIVLLGAIAGLLTGFIVGLFTAWYMPTPSKEASAKP